MLSIQRACAGVSGTRGSNGAARGDGGVGSGVGLGRGGIDATTPDVPDGAGLRAHETTAAVGYNTATAIIARVRDEFLIMFLK